jgi:hypothetical protein
LLCKWKVKHEGVIFGKIDLLRMNRNELIIEFAKSFNTVSSFIESNKGKVAFKHITPRKQGQKINGFTHSIFQEYGFKDGVIVMDLFSTFLQASLNMTSSSAKSFHAIFIESNSDVGLGSALAASRTVSESAIKIHYLTSMPLEIGIRFLFAEYIEHSRKYCESQSATEKPKLVAMHTEFVTNAGVLLSKLNLPTNPQIDALEKSDRKLLNDALKESVVSMAEKSKVHINGNFKKLTLDNLDHDKLVYNYRVANGFVHMNPSFITAGSKNRHFWLTMMVLPTMYINCMLMTKFMPTSKASKMQDVLLRHVQDYKNLHPEVIQNWRK